MKAANAASAHHITEEMRLAAENKSFRRRLRQAANDGLCEWRVMCDEGAPQELALLFDLCGKLAGAQVDAAGLSGDDAQKLCALVGRHTAWTVRAAP